MEVYHCKFFRKEALEHERFFLCNELRQLNKSLLHSFFVKTQKFHMFDLTCLRMNAHAEPQILLASLSVFPNAFFCSKKNKKEKEN